MASTFGPPPRADEMTTVTAQSPAGRPLRAQRSALQSVLQSIGALIITAVVLYLLFGIPARLLFGIFFD